jgi:hypothetical protein
MICNISKENLAIYRNDCNEVNFEIYNERRYLEKHINSYRWINKKIRNDRINESCCPVCSFIPSDLNKF